MRSLLSISASTCVAIQFRAKESWRSRSDGAAIRRTPVIVAVEQEQLRFGALRRGHRLDQRPQVQVDSSVTVEQHRVAIDELAVRHVRRHARLSPPPGPPLGRTVARHHEHVVEHEPGCAEQRGQVGDQAYELPAHRILGDGVFRGRMQEERIEPVGAVGARRHQIDQLGDRMGSDLKVACLRGRRVVFFSVWIQKHRLPIKCGCLHDSESDLGSQRIM
jgi:hypothetical protein